MAIKEENKWIMDIEAISESSNYIKINLINFTTGEIWQKRFTLQKFHDLLYHNKNRYAKKNGKEKDIPCIFGVVMRGKAGEGL